MYIYIYIYKWQRGARALAETYTPHGPDRLTLEPFWGSAFVALFLFLICSTTIQVWAPLLGPFGIGSLFFVGSHVGSCWFVFVIKEIH